MQLPGHGGRVRGHFFGARLRPHAIAFDVAFQADPLDRVRIRELVVQMRSLLRVRFEENNLRADLLGRAQGFGERIGRLHWNVDRAIVFASLPSRDDEGCTESPTFPAAAAAPAGRPAPEIRAAPPPRSAVFRRATGAAAPRRTPRGPAPPGNSGACPRSRLPSLMSVSSDIAQGLFTKSLHDGDPHHVRSYVRSSRSVPLDTCASFMANRAMLIPSRAV